MKNHKSTVFSCLSLDFLVFIFFKKNQNLNFLNCNRPVFSEPKKLVRIGVVDFCKNQPIFVDIVIHGDAPILFRIVVQGDNPSESPVMSPRGGGE
jgi:hypothetical protein